MSASENDPEAGTHALRLCGGLGEVAEADWDACAGRANPFVGHAFLQALEESGCATAETGWRPCHMLLEDASGRLVGAAPMYLKSHSQGEYVFDHGWANAYERAGGSYYPKLQIAAPFTPATGPRFLVRDGEDVALTRRLLLQGATQAASRMGVSGLHVTFPTEEEARLGREQDWLFRTGEQFHWFNRDYGSFDDFLADLSSRKRKAIRRERAGALADNITIEELTGAALTEAHWDAFFHFYLDTSSRKWGQPYLNRSFFSLLGERLGDRVVLMMAKRDGRYIAGALNIVGTETLFGRYWGCIEEHRFLHFELCYYRAIDWALRRGLKRVEAGAQGPHKLARGYLPVTTHSIHWIADEGFRRAVADYLEHERREVQREIDYLGDFSPFRKDGKYRPDIDAV